MKTYAAEDNDDPRLRTGSPGNHPFFPSSSPESDPRDPDGSGDIDG